MLSAIRTVITEVVANLKRTWRLARYEKRAKNSQSLLGNLWEILNPLLNILVYWFVFSVGLRTSAGTDVNYPYAVWLICGIIPWLTISGAMTQSSSSITSASGLIKTCNIPLSMYPLKCVVHGLISHLFSLVVLAAVIIIAGIPLTWHVLEIVYYTLAMLLFLLGFALVASTISVFFNDLQKLLPPILRLLMYASSVVLNINQYSPDLQFIMRLNPMVHLVEGIRFSLLDGKGLMTHPESFISFWVATVVLFALGCWMHVRTREQFIDVL
ncbi:MAG: ABC transporter permease [Clostridiales bacterium]|nr:ABC transporter permease [Clostridiales bacterium]MBE5811795.1 ABC transporter permease [Clostridiales bacterium]